MTDIEEADAIVIGSGMGGLAQGPRILPGRVRVLAGIFETDSRGMFSAAELSAGWLLACQTLPTSDMTISTEAF